ncbi:MAG: hypothetical protein AB7G75_14095 [Candidatus Binatia bacterium]
MPGTDDIRSRNTRFYRSLLVPTVLLFGWFGLVSFLVSRAGVAIGLISGSCFVLALVLAYWTAADVLNLRVIRGRHGKSRFRDGEIVAFDGVVQVEGEPLRSPFTAQPCAAYTYKISASRGATSHRRHSLFVLSQGFHMLKSKIKNDGESLRLCCLPEFADDLREGVQGAKWLTEARELIEKNVVTASSADEREREGMLLDARHTEVEEVHRDYCMSTDLGNGHSLVIEEEVLPVDQHVCIVGTYDAKRDGLTARKRR